MALGCVLAVATPAWALNHDGSNGGPSSLFLSVLDPLTQTSYYRDLQVTYRQFLDNPALTLDLAGDSRFADLLGKDGLLFNIAAFHRLSADGANLSSWGYLLTHTGSRADLAGDFVSIDAVRQRMQIYASQLTDTAGTFHAGEAGYFDGDNWGASLGGLVGGSTVGHPGQPVAFYRVNNNTGDVAGGRVEQLGSWLLTRDGKLSFDRTASGNLPPQVDIAGSGAARVGETVILDGSGSRDQDQGPEPLRHAWIRLSGPLATLENPQSPKAGFTPAQPGRYRFRLTVGDGEANASATLDIAVEAAANQAPVVQLETRLSGRVGQRVTLDGSRSYDPDNVPGPLRFQWTPSGGPATTLAGAESAQASFTPDLPGAWRVGRRRCATHRLDNPGRGAETRGALAVFAGRGELQDPGQRRRRQGWFPLEAEAGAGERNRCAARLRQAQKHIGLGLRRRPHRGAQALARHRYPATPVIPAWPDTLPLRGSHPPGSPA